MTTKITEKNISNIANLAIDWQAVITADGSTQNSVAAGKGYFVDTTSGEGYLNLPTSVSRGDTIAIKDYAGTFATNQLKVNTGGAKVNGVDISGVNQNNEIAFTTNNTMVVLVYIDATKGWTITENSAKTVSTDDPNISYISATGGTVTESGDYKIHTFTGDGCFVVSAVGAGPESYSEVDYLVLAGGGGGGRGESNPSGVRQSGGGGAGGYRESRTDACAPWTGSPLASTTGLSLPAATYPITVGGGGAGSTGTSSTGSGGSNSIFSTITSTGGGGGGSSQCGRSGTPGGSGGGGGGRGGGYTGGNGTGNTPPVSPPQGNSGGTSAAPFLGTPGSSGGGGGGAGAAGCNGGGPHDNPSLGPGNGGAGVTSSISGSPIIRGGGGAGNGPSAGSPGPGGGGAASGGNGGANTGGGGGGDNNTGGTGGTGLVLIRYKFQN